MNFSMAGVDTELDKSYLVQSKKPSERKAVKKAYEEAILHRYLQEMQSVFYLVFLPP